MSTGSGIAFAGGLAVAAFLLSIGQGWAAIGVALVTIAKTL